MSFFEILTVTLISIAVILTAVGYRIRSILVGSQHVTITFSPHELHIVEVILAIMAMISKPLYRSTVGKLRGVLFHGAPDDLTLAAPFQITKEDITRYNKAVPAKSEPSQLLLLLAALSEPAMLLLLANPLSPVNPLGAVNVRNRFELLRPDLCVLPALMTRDGAGLVARIKNEASVVKRGVEYELEVVIMMPDHSRANSKTLVPVFRQIFTMLEFRKTKGLKLSNAVPQMKASELNRSPSTSPVQISFSNSEPLKWAEICKDYNFIHLSGLAARALGLPGKLAHGNHVVAKALSMLPEHGKLGKMEDQPSWMEVQFRRPVVVPSNLEVRLRDSSEGVTSFVVSRKGQNCVLVEYGTL